MGRIPSSANLSGDLPRPTDPAPLAYDSRATVWVAAHLEELCRQYPNQWVLVEADRVVAHADNPIELEEISERRGIKAAFITRVAPPSGLQKMIYAGQVV
jgi:hypothetical protein